MALKFNRVRPGSLISADLFNSVLDALEDLDSRIGAGTITIPVSSVRIAAVSPTGGPLDPIRPKTLVQITGQNFGYSAVQPTIAFEGGPYGTIMIPHSLLLTGSSDSRLLFELPEIPGIGTGMTMTLRIDNGVTHDIRSVFVQPLAITLNGYVFMQWRANLTPNPNPNPLRASTTGQTEHAEFGYQVKSAGLNMPATFDLTANIVTASAAIPAGLNGSIEFYDAETDNLIPNKRLDLGKNDTRNITVRIPQIPAAWVNQNFTLEVTATSETVTNTDKRTFPIGQQVVTADDVEIQQLEPIVYNSTSHAVDTGQQFGKLDGATIKLKTGYLIDVPFNVTFKQAGRYHVTVQPQTGSSSAGWSLGLVDTLEYIPANAGAMVSVGETTTVTFEVTAPPLPLPTTAVTNFPLVLTIQRQGAASGFNKEFTVELLS